MKRERSASIRVVDADSFRNPTQVPAKNQFGGNQRLEASAEPGTIRCAEMVKLLARGRGGHEFVPLGELTLKGLPEPLLACEVRWKPLDDEVASANVELGLPPVFAHAGNPFVVGEVLRHLPPRPRR